MKLRTLLLTAFGAAVVLCAVSCQKDQKGFNGTPIDLGLSVKWAGINIGATLQGDTGNEMTLEEAQAYVAEGRKWRLPAISDWGELLNNCDWHFAINDDGTKGYLVIGKTEGKTIYVPAGKYLGEQAGDKIKYYDLTTDTPKIATTSNMTEKFFVRLVR